MTNPPPFNSGLLPDGTVAVKVGSQAGTPGFSGNMQAADRVWDPTNITGSDVSAVFISAIARLVTEDVTKPDQRANATYYLAVGGSMYQNWTQGVGVGRSRFKRVTSDFQAFSAVSFLDAPLLASLPVGDSLVPQVGEAADWVVVE